jgi:NADH-quinone oxidoreductase subunit L
MNLLPWAWVLTLPGLLLTTLGVGKRPGIASVPGPLLVGLAGLAWIFGGQRPVEVRIDGWLPLLPDGTFHLRLDGLSAAMLAVVGLVSFCIYVYSLAYMADHHGQPHPGQRRYFAYLDLFVASMALLVLGGTTAVLLIGWGGVGLASFFLISFYREREGTLSAGLQALAANAVGDGALLLAVVLVPVGCGDLTSLASPRCLSGPGGADLLAWLILIAAAAKSAQGPLYFWLPSAMAGPTPVSALIHAATMVAAGVYLLARTHALLLLAPQVLLVTAWVGVLTALFSAVASLQQSNLKRGIAYSTLSQLGYMFAGVGFGAPFAAFFHLVTHAAFKALLFLTAGVVIHSHANGSEEIADLRGAQHALPRAALAFLIGSLALIGLPVVTAGAFSKDAILEAGLGSQPLLASLLIGGVFLTGLYSGRLYFSVFSGGPNHQIEGQPSPLLLWPLLPLALGAILLGYVEWPLPALSHLLEPAVGEGEPVHLISTIGLLAAALGLLGFGAAFLWCRRAGAAARLSIGGLPWVAATARASEALAAEVAAVNSGRLGAYVFTSVLGLAIVLLLAKTVVR